jgi:hypothetical protein
VLGYMLNSNLQNPGETILGYFGLTMPGVSVKPCHFERSFKVG